MKIMVYDTTVEVLQPDTSSKTVAVLLRLSKELGGNDEKPYTRKMTARLDRASAAALIAGLEEYLR